MGCNDSNDRDQMNNFKVFNRLNLGGVVADDTYDFTNPIEGVDGNGPSFMGAGTSDRLFIRRSVGGSAIQLATPFIQGDQTLILNTANANFAALNKWQILALSDCEKTAIFMITNVPDTNYRRNKV